MLVGVIRDWKTNFSSRLLRFVLLFCALGGSKPTDGQVRAKMEDGFGQRGCVCIVCGAAPLVPLLPLK